MSDLAARARPRVRVMVIDGEAAIRRALVQLLAGDMTELVGTAINARTALAKLQSYRPDVVVVDAVSAGVEGLDLVRQLRRDSASTGVVLLTRDENSAAALQSSAEFLHCHVLVRTALAAVPQAACVAAGRRGVRAAAAAATPAATFAGPSAASVAVAPAVASVPRRRRATTRAEIVGIGTSTGGPNALAAMLPMLPADFPLPILIVQHMPAGFTASLAQALHRTCKLPVREARDGDAVLAGQILIAPGGRHMCVDRNDHGAVIRLTDDPPEHGCRPAVDYLFRSLCRGYGAATVAVIMTGMGEDGFAGCRALHQDGALIVAQDESSCTVFGMPRGPIGSGIADVIAPLDQLAVRITEACKVKVLR